MVEITTRWWGIIVELTHDEACFVAAPRTELMQVFNLIPPPFGQVVGAAVSAAKAAMRQSVGTDGLSLHATWAGVPHWFGRRGNPSPCAVSAFAADGTAPARIPLLVNVIEPAAEEPMPAGLQVEARPIGVFRVTENTCYEATTEQGLFSIEFNNNSGEWVAVDVVRPDGNVDRTSRVPNGQRGSIDNIITVYKGAQCVINRWRPGLFGLPGTGGGRIEFTVPAAAGRGILKFDING